MVWSFRLMLLGLLISCTQQVEIKPLDPAPYFHGNGSKLWVIQQVLLKGENYAAANLADKEVLMFFEDGSMMLTGMKQLGNYPKKAGQLYFHADGKECEFDFPEEDWRFKIVHVGKKRIVLYPKNPQTFPYRLVLTAYPSPIKVK